MKRFLVFILFLILIPTLYAQWEWVNPKPQGNLLMDMHLFNADSFLIVGYAGTVIKTYNKGNNWNTQHFAGYTNRMGPVAFADNNLGYALGTYGDFYKTTDGGTNWSYISCFYQWKNAIVFCNSNVGYIFGDYGSVLKTTNSGVNWNGQTSNTNQMLNSACFINDLVGIAVGVNGTIIKTTNGGSNWIQKISNTTFELTSINLISEQVGIAVGENGVIVKSSDGGDSWSLLNCGVSDYLTAVTCIDENNFIIISNLGKIIKTTNGGNTWSAITYNENIYLSTIKSIQNNVYIVGNFGLILISTNGGITWEEKSNSISISNLRSMSKVNDELLWIAGDGGVILHSSDSGENWINQVSSINENLLSIDFIDQNRGWAVGLNGVIISTSNAGDTWQIQEYLATRNFRKVDFYDSQFGIAVGDNGTIFKTTNGGNTWIDRTTGSFDMADIYISDYNTAWILYSDWNSNTGKVIKSTDQGDTWNLIGSIPTYYGMNCIYFVNNQLGFAGTNNGIYKTTNGGVNWSFTGAGNYVFDINFLNNYMGWACGRDGLIYKTLNGGNSWITFYSILREKVTNNYLYSVQFINESKGFACGSGGVIIKTLNAAPTPVELTSFTALMRLNKVHLNWQTATELNNQGFEILRKFENSDWATIGIRTGKGTTTEPTSYFLEDDISEISVTKILYRLKQIDFDGTVSYSDQVEVVAQPFSFALLQNYPNPFNPSTTIAYSIPQKSNVSLKIYDIVGKEIATLVNEQKEEGTYNIQFDASRLSSGVYIYSIQAGDFLENRKMVLMK